MGKKKGRRSREPAIPDKPGSLIGKIGEGGAIIPCCIMCERELSGEAHLKGVWVDEDNKRNYMYSICDACSEKYEIKEIEEKIMLTLATKNHFKAEGGR